MNAPEQLGTPRAMLDVPQSGHGEDVVSEDELADAVHYLSSRFAEFSITPGCPVGVLSSGGYPDVVAAHALAQLGAAVVLLEADGTPCATTARLRDLGVEFLVGRDSSDLLFDEVVDAMHFGEIPSVVAEEYSLVRIASCADAVAVEEMFGDRVAAFVG